jgi:hypothetical protein
MTNLSASALDDDPQGCALLKQALASKDVSTEGAVGRPVLTDAESVVSAIAQLGRPNDSKDEIYDRLLRAYVIDLDVLGGVVEQTLAAQRAAKLPEQSAWTIRRRRRREQQVA